MTIISARFINARDIYGRDTTDQYVAAYDDNGVVRVMHKDSSDPDLKRFLAQPNFIDPYLAVAKPPDVPVLAQLVPDKAFVGGPDFDIQVVGENFTADSKIMWNGGEEPTVFVSPELLTTGVQPSTATVGGATIEIHVDTLGEITRSRFFTFM
jgi:hypothetical protein